MRHIHFTKNIIVLLANSQYLFYFRLIVLRLNTFFMQFRTHFLELSYYKLSATSFYGDECGKKGTIVYCAKRYDNYIKVFINNSIK